MLRHQPLAAAAALLVAGTLSGCGAHRVAEVAPVSAPAPIPPRPMPPAGFAAAPAIPAQAADGSYPTPNAGLGAARAAWHLRSALNVAALACRGTQEAALIQGYNLMLQRQRAPLAAAYEAIRADDRARYGKGWEAAHDAEMTRLYNFFAQPFATQDFCVAAGAVMARAGAADPAAFGAEAGAMLAALDAPFTAGYARYDAYRRDLALWEARYGTGTDAGPQLVYAPLDAVLAWAPGDERRQVALAGRR